MCDSGRLINFGELRERILQFDNVLIAAHINPDPDTLGSALGLKWLFAKLGKAARIFCDMAVSERICGYLDIAPGIDGVVMGEGGDKGDKFDYVVAVDAASEHMLGKSLAGREIDLVIDHHYTNSLYGREIYLDAGASATGEIIFALAKDLGVAADREFAKNIYCALVCDSGSFRYSSTTPQTMRIAAELIETGFDFAKTNRLIFENKSLEQVAVERLAYNCLKLHGGGRIAVINITRELKKEAGLEGREIEGISAIPRIIEGVEVGVLIKETDGEKLEDKANREFRISLRSNDYVNVAEIASQLGGGGHVRAAGCKFTARPGMKARHGDNPAEYLERLLIGKIEEKLEP